MKLSKAERLILFNQFTILEKLDPDGEKEYTLNKKILENGYVQNYGDLVEWFSDDLSESVTEEVWEILQMHRSLCFSYNELEEKDGITEDDIKFNGFDGNNESGYFTYAKFIINDLERFQELRDKTKYPSYNSHFPMIEKYRRMVDTWKEEPGSHKNKLSADQIRRIINA